MQNLFWVSLILFLVSSNAWPKENWLCTEDSSQVQGNRILACGVGEGKYESISRKRAFDSAKEEFSNICSSQSNCGQYEYSATPSRSTCEETEKGWVCHRLIIYEIKPDKRRVSAESHSETTLYIPAVRDTQMDQIDALIDKQLTQLLGGAQ